MKKIGIILLGVGFGVLCYIVLSFLFKKESIVSPIEESNVNKVIQQNGK